MFFEFLFSVFMSYRSKGGVENPSLEQYMYTKRKIIVSKSNMIIKRGNTRGRKDKKTVIDVNDTRELPKRPKKRKIIKTKIAKTKSKNSKI